MDNLTREKIAEFICGDDQAIHPHYRSSWYLTKFFNELDVNVEHDGSTRKWWTLDVLKTLSTEQIEKVISKLANPKEYAGDKGKVRLALLSLNNILELEGLKILIDGITPKLINIIPNFNLENDETSDNFVEDHPVNFNLLNLDDNLTKLLSNRWLEIQNCMSNKAHLSSLILMGSVLEGILLGLIKKHPRECNTQNCTPKKDGKAKPFHEWSLSEMIDVAHHVGWIELDVKKFSHSLREFRNLIHPNVELALGSTPNEDTCKISLNVIKAACNDIEKWISKN